VGRLKIIVLYDRWEEDDDSAPDDKTPLTRTLDKKEVEEEVADALGKLGHETTLHCLDGSTKSLHALARMECDLVFNLAESFGGNDTADAAIAGYLELIDKRFTGAGSHGLLYAQDKAIAKKILEFHGLHTPVFARSYRGRLDFSHDLEFPVIVKPAREDGSIGIEFNAVVNSIRELMERIDWLHANFDSPVLIEEYVEGREMYVGVIGNENPAALPVVELDLSKLPEGTPRIEVSGDKHDGMWRIAVRDNGIGIDPKFHKEVFEPFRRLHRRDEYPGTGIGLAICQRIVELHGGRLWVESKPGAGSTFYFTLPEAPGA